MPSDTAALAAEPGEPTPAARASDPQWFRKVLGQYPTGVCVVTAIDPNGVRAGLVVGSFASVSLSPPLIVFFPDRSSSSWPKIERAGRFCVNVLAADQEEVCRRFSAKAFDKFDGLEVGISPSGMPLLNGVVAWIDCQIQAVQEIGDHFAVFGRVLDLGIGVTASPLLFLEGGYGRFARHSVTEIDVNGDLTPALRAVEMIRSDIEKLADSLRARCVVTALAGAEVVVVATAGSANDQGSSGTLVGQRLPFSAPTASVLAAWTDDDRIEQWLARMPSPGAREVQREHLAAVRRRGYSLALKSDSSTALAALERVADNPDSLTDDDVHGLFGRLTYDPADSEGLSDNVGLVTVPIFTGPDSASIALHVYGFTEAAGDETSDDETADRILAIRQVADLGSERLARSRPAR